jgi:hypothetical protein
MIIVPLLPGWLDGWLGLLVGGLFAIVALLVVFGILLYRFHDDCWM